jgi:pentose-5-phosphate-3-epimerase
MDGHFVPNISFGAVMVEALRPVTRLPLEVHLMIADPDMFLDEFVAAGRIRSSSIGKETTICIGQFSTSGRWVRMPE